MNNLEYKPLENLIENELNMQTQRFEQKQKEIMNNKLKEKDKEIERLNNIIDELEYCIENSYGELGYGIFYIFRINGKEECFDNINEVKEVIQKLKEEKSKKE